MDKTIPAGAAHLLDFIASYEAPQGYATIFGNNHDKLRIPITSMDLDGVMSSQETFARRYGSSAVGRYQFTSETLMDLKNDLGLSGLELFKPDLQDRLAYHLIKRRGYASFMAGTIDAAEFGMRLAKEWAALPVLDSVQRVADGHVVTRGQSYYAGDGKNRALVPPEAVEEALTSARRLFAIPGSEMVATALPDLPAAIESIKVEPAKPKTTLASIIWRRITGKS